MGVVEPFNAVVVPVNISFITSVISISTSSLPLEKCCVATIVVAVVLVIAVYGNNAYLEYSEDVNELLPVYTPQVESGVS